MRGAAEAYRQREQLERYLQWVKAEGSAEGPTRLDTLWKPHQQERLRWLKQHCVGRVMELGTSWGWVLSYCQGDVGVDHNVHNIALARILSPGRTFVVADIRNLPFTDGHVETVMACDVLEHLPWEDVPKALGEALRVARRKVLITTPNGEYGTPEATSAKHQFLLTHIKMRELLDMLQYYKLSYESNEHFVYIEVEKC